jgi:hypothetical protein
MTTTNYEEQATKLYNFNKENNWVLLENILIDLADTNGEPIFDLGEWLDEFDNNAELVQIVQQSDHFDINDNYIKEGIYYRDCTTGDSITELIGDEKAIEWIASALEYDPETVEDLDIYTED